MPSTKESRRRLRIKVRKARIRKERKEREQIMACGFHDDAEGLPYDDGADPDAQHFGTLVQWGDDWAA